MFKEMNEFMEERKTYPNQPTRVSYTARACPSPCSSRPSAASLRGPCGWLVLHLQLCRVVGGPPVVLLPWADLSEPGWVPAGRRARTGAATDRCSHAGDSMLTPNKCTTQGVLDGILQIPRSNPSLQLPEFPPLCFTHGLMGTQASLTAFWPPDLESAISLRSTGVFQRQRVILGPC